MSRQKFKIYYPEDYHDESLRGKEYKPLCGKFVVMTGEGIFLICEDSDYYQHFEKLSSVLPKYDVKWV